MKVSLETGTRFTLRVLTRVLCFGFVACAVVPRSTVLTPRPHADPAKLLKDCRRERRKEESVAGQVERGWASNTNPVASLARHVLRRAQSISCQLRRKEARKTTNIASSILLDRGMTFDAFLRIRANPVGSLTIVGTLLQPSLDDRTTARPVVRLRAAKAERVAARATNGGNHDVERARRNGAFDGVLAVWGGAPAEVGVVVDVGTVEEGSVAERRQGVEKRWSD